MTSGWLSAGDCPLLLEATPLTGRSQSCLFASTPAGAFHSDFFLCDQLGKMAFKGGTCLGKDYFPRPCSSRLVGETRALSALEGIACGCVLGAVRTLLPHR